MRRNLIVFSETHIQQFYSHPTDYNPVQFQNNYRGDPYSFIGEVAVNLCQELLSNEIYPKVISDFLLIREKTKSLQGNPIIFQLTKQY